MHTQILRGAGWNVAGYAFGGFLAVAFPLLLLQWIGKANYGIVSYLAFLISQVYLLDAGMGDVVAQRLTRSASLGKLPEGIHSLRAGLGLIWITSATLSVLWIGWGVELFRWLLPLEPAHIASLEKVRWWVPPALWGMQTGMYLARIPIALGRFRFAALQTILQAFWQSLFPLILTWTLGKSSPYFALLSILIGYSAYGVSAWLGASWLLQELLLPGSLKELPSLLKDSLWVVLNLPAALIPNFFERTWVGREWSLGLMGFYSAVHYIFSKASAFLLKANEALFPVFGSQQVSSLRQHFRLAQSIWLLNTLTTTGAMIGWGALEVAFAYLQINFQPEERLIIAGAIGTLTGISLVGVSNIFYQSRGYFFLVWLANSLLTGVQLLFTPPLVAHGLILWASVPGVLAFFVLHSYRLRRHPAFALWKTWVMGSYLRSILFWLGGSLIFVSDALPVIGKALCISALGAIHFVMEYLPPSAWRKRALLGQIAAALMKRRALYETSLPVIERP